MPTSPFALSFTDPQPAFAAVAAWLARDPRLASATWTIADLEHNSAPVEPHPVLDADIGDTITTSLLAGYTRVQLIELDLETTDTDGRRWELTVRDGTFLTLCGYGPLPSVTTLGLPYIVEDPRSFGLE